MPVNRLWQIGAAIVAVGALALAWFLGVSPAMAAHESAAAQLASLKSTNDQTVAKIVQLAKAKQQLPQLQQQLADLRGSVPTDADAPGFVTEINAAASQSGVTVTGISISDAQPYKPATAPANSGSSSSTSTATPAPGSTPAPTPTVAPGMPPVTNSLITDSTMAVIPVSITATGTLSQSLDFVKALQFGTRLYLVTNVSTNPVGGEATGPNDPFTLTLSGSIYALTGSAAQASATH
jgi:Tfp pilus assembly protein PilO